MNLDTGPPPQTEVHTVVAVGDLGRSLRFYSTITGWRFHKMGTVEDVALARAMGVERVLFRYACIRLRNHCLVLREFEQPVPWRGAVDIVDNGNVHVCLEVDDLDDVISRVYRLGAVANGPPAPAPHPHKRSGIEWVIFLDGPDGEHVELMGLRSSLPDYQIG